MRRCEDIAKVFGAAMAYRFSTITGWAAPALAVALLVGGGEAQAADCVGEACYKLVKTPPVYRTIEKTRLVRPARTQARLVPARYGYVTENVMTEPGHTIAHHRPAQFTSVSEKVMISPPTRRWEVRTDAFGNTFGCWVDVPAQFGYQQRTVQVQPASVEYETVPAVYVQRQRQVMLQPTRVVRETIPPVYETRRKQVMVSPGAKYWEPF